MLPDYAKTVCKFGEGAACCRYLMGGPNGVECAKLQPPYKAMIDERVAEGSFTARADNCPGKADLYDETSVTE